MSSNGSLDQLITTSRFMLEVDGIARASFQKASGGGTESEVIEYQESGAGGQVIDRKVMGRTTYNDLEMSKCIDGDLYLSDWRKEVQDGMLESARRTGSLVALDSEGAEVARWNFEHAWPSKIEFGEFDASANDVAVETVTFVVEYFERAS